MIRPTIKHCLELAAGIVAVLASLAALGAWLVASGPLSLDLVAPNIRDAVNRNLVGYRVDFESVNVQWFSRVGTFDVRVSDVHIFNAIDELIVDVPEIDLLFGVGSILRGDPSPRRVEILGASAVIIRRANGEFQLGLESPMSDATESPSDEAVAQTNQTAEFMGPLIASIFLSPEQDSASSAIDDFVIREASLTFHDEPTGSIWEATGALIEFTQSKNLGVGRLEATIDVQGMPVSIWLDGRHDLSSGDTTFQVEFSDVAPASLAKKLGGSTLFERVSSPVSGTMSLKFLPDGTLDFGEVVFLASNGIIDLSGIVLHGKDAILPEGEPEWVRNAPPSKWDAEPPPLESIQIDGAILEASWDLDSKRILIQQLAAYGPDNQVTFVGDITAKMQEDQPYVPARVSLGMRAEDSNIFVAGVLEDKLDIDDFSFLLTFDLLERQLIVEDVSLSAYGGTAHVSGAIVEGYADDGGLAPQIRLKGDINDVPIATVTKMWPVFVGIGTRDWISENITNGIISRGDLRVTLEEGERLQGDLPKDAIQLDFSFEGVGAHYIRGLTPITNAVGSATLYRNSFLLTVSRADIGNLVATNGIVDNPRFVPKGAVATYTVTVAGDAREILEVINMEPLALTNAFGLDPQNVSGNAIVTLKIGRPQRRYVPVEIITYEVVAEARNLSLANGIEGLPLTNGELSIAITNTGIQGDGAIDIAGVPANFVWHESFNTKDDLSTTYVIDIETDASELYKLGIEAEPFFQGTVLATIETTGNGFEFSTAKVDLNLSQTAVDFSVFDWEKDSGVAANSSFFIEHTEEGTSRIRDFRLLGDGIDVAGEFELAENFRLLNANFPLIKMGESMDLSLQSTRHEEEDRLILDLQGKKFFGGVLLRNFIFSLGGEASAPTSVGARWDSVKLKNGVMLQDVSLNFLTKDGLLIKCDVDASFDEGGGISVALSEVPNGRRHMTISSTDGGAVVRALMDNTGVIGGTMELSMELAGVEQEEAGPHIVLPEPSKPQTVAPIIDGEAGGPELDVEGGQSANSIATSDATYGAVTLENFRVVNLPALARLLSAASLSGVRDLMNGDGLWFDQMKVPFVLNGSKLEVNKASASGPSVGLTLEGYYDRSVEELDLVGTLVPAYSVNTILGNVPVIGELFVSRKGEGVLGLTYRIQGQPEEARIFVNPLSALAPGFLRRLFQIGEPEVSGPLDDLVLPTVSQPLTSDPAVPEAGSGDPVSIPLEVPVD